MIGGEQWGEIVEGSIGSGYWKTARWKQALTGQFAAALERGELWNDRGTQAIARLPISQMQAVCNIGPQDRQIRGSLGAFDAHRGWNGQAQFPALWAQSASVHRGMTAEPNAWLTPQPGKDYGRIWAQSGRLHVTRDVGYNSQRVMAARTNSDALGIRAWFTLNVPNDDPAAKSQQEIALALWCNSTLGLLLHAHHANRVQQGRGLGSKGMLKTMPALDVRQLQSWQLEQAQTIWRRLKGLTFQPFHNCTIDPRPHRTRRTTRHKLPRPTPRRHTNTHPNPQTPIHRTIHPPPPPTVIVIKIDPRANRNPPRRHSQTPIRHSRKNGNPLLPLPPSARPLHKCLATLYRPPIFRWKKMRIGVIRSALRGQLGFMQRSRLRGKVEMGVFARAATATRAAETSSPQGMKP